MSNGRHLILDLYDCDKQLLDNYDALRELIETALRMSNATILRIIGEKFEPQGVTGLALLAESHISIHTWPESGYAAVDVFTCGDHTMPERACAVLSEELNAARFKLKSFLRETPSEVAGADRAPVAAVAAARLN